MFKYVTDKEFLSDMRRASGEMMQGLCHILKEEYDIGARFYLVGSGGRNMITQNENEPVDLDNNLEIVRCSFLNDGRRLKECVRKAFNQVLNERGLSDCRDSTIPLTSGSIGFCQGNQTPFTIDVCITARINGGYCRLKHEKTGQVSDDRYYWNHAPNSSEIRERAEIIKGSGKWELVRNQYLQLKNKYLRRNDTDHPSFVCYAEAVNNVYNSMRDW